jgi:3'-phosphoadenosine 5'-phosphosulfate sulfotransferase (PAPS reductase)/FAD synthetase
VGAQRQRLAVRSLADEEPIQSAHPQGKLARVSSISNWTELDVWQYLAEEALAVPLILRGCF